MHLAIFEYLAIYKYAVIFESQFSLTLASFFLLANYLLVKLISKKVIKAEKIMIKDCRYLIFTQNLPGVFFNLFDIIYSNRQ